MRLDEKCITVVSDKHIQLTPPSSSRAYITGKETQYGFQGMSLKIGIFWQISYNVCLDTLRSLARSTDKYNNPFPLIKREGRFYTAMTSRRLELFYLNNRSSVLLLFATTLK